MNEFISKLFEIEINTGIFIFIFFFALGVSFFHYVIFAGLYNLKLNRYFLGLYPLIILLTYVAYPSAVVFIFLLIFALTFVFGLIGILFVAPFLSAKRDIIDRQKYQKKINRQVADQAYRKTNSKDDNPTKEAIKKVAQGFVLFVLFAIFGLTGNVGLFFFLVLVGVIVNAFLWKGNLFSLQRHLPTSKIRSVAMGLAEIEGKIKIDQAIESRINKRRCAGYYYEIQKISSDEDGKKSYTTISVDYVFNPFYLQDETGRIKIIPEKLLLLHFEETTQYLGGGKRAVEYILEEDGKNYMMIGKVAYEGNETVFRYDENRKILSITPSAEVRQFNENRKDFLKFAPYLVVILLWIFFVLLCEVELSQTGLTIKPPEFLQKFLGKVIE